MRRILVVLALLACLETLVGCGTRVPDVKGMTPEQAEATLKSAGFAVSPPRYDESAKGSLGAVIEQTPSAGRRAVSGSVVSLTVAGPPPVEVPAVEGLTSREASAALQAVGLAAGEVTEAFDSSVTAGSVISQNPAGGKYPRGSKVALVISKGPQPVAIPPVEGKSETQAREALEAAGFKVTVSRRHDNSDEGTVIGQSPSKGLAQPGSTVALTVSSGIEKVRVPNIAGMLDPDPVLRRAGLVPKGVAIHGPIESDAAGIGQAYRQRPRAGSLVPKGTVVTYHFWWEAG